MYSIAPAASVDIYMCVCIYIKIYIHMNIIMYLLCLLLVHLFLCILETLCIMQTLCILQTLLCWIFRIQNLYSIQSVWAQEMAASQWQRKNKDNSGFEGLNLLTDEVCVSLWDLTLFLLICTPWHAMRTRACLATISEISNNYFHILHLNPLSGPCQWTDSFQITLSTFLTDCTR